MMRSYSRVLCSVALTLSLWGCGSGQNRGLSSGQPGRDTVGARDLNNRAAEKIEQGKFEDARKLLEDAIAADPTFAPAHNNLGLIHFENGALYQAAQEFEIVIKLQPQAAPPRNNLGLVFESAGKLDEAVRRFEQAQRIDPNHPEYLGNVLRARLRRGDKAADLREMLNRLVLIETRPEWREWAREQIARIPRTDKLD